MTNFTNITLALDLSLNGPGFAVIAVFEGKPILLEKSHIVSRASAKHGEKLTVIGAEIERYFKAYSPNHVVREKGFSRFAATTQALFKVVGVSEIVAYEFGHKAVAEIPPTTVKKAITGSGKASKDEVAAEVLRILQIEQADYFDTDDESDAAAVGITYLRQKGLIT